MSEFLFRKNFQEYPEEQVRLVDLKVAVDGTLQKGDWQPASVERKKVRELRELIEAVVAGEADLETLMGRLSELSAALRQASETCQKLGQDQPDHAPFFADNVACYQRSIDGLVIMQSAIEQDDSESLWKGWAGFESGVLDIEALHQAHSQ